MKVKAACEQGIAPGTRVRVTVIAESEAEKLGYVDDGKTLLAKTGRVARVLGTQIVMAWEGFESNLMLAPEDEIEVLP